ncbi:MAG: hypothetical protein AAF957_07645 [Planctomycetota bacterium]
MAQDDSVGRMFSHLREDWPWIVVPFLVVSAVAVATAIALTSGGDAPTFVYDL